METIQEFELAMIPIDSLNCLYLQKYSYFAPSTLSTSNITGNRSRYPMSANKNFNKTRSSYVHLSVYKISPKDYKKKI